MERADTRVCLQISLFACRARSIHRPLKINLPTSPHTAVHRYVIHESVQKFAVIKAHVPTVRAEENKLPNASERGALFDVRVEEFCKIIVSLVATNVMTRHLQGLDVP